MTLNVSVVLEVGLTSTPFGAFSWTDISNRVLSVSMVRGGPYETNQIDAATLVMDLRNEDGYLDPDNTGSAAYPYISINTPIRYSVIVGGITYRRFRGFAKRWPIRYEDGDRAVTTLTAVGIFKVALGYKFPVGYRDAVIGQSTSYWSFDGVLTADNASVANTISTFYTTGVTYDYGSAVVMDGGQALRATTTATSTQAQPFFATAINSLEAWYCVDTVPAGTRGTFLLMGYGPEDPTTPTGLFAVDNGGTAGTSGYELATGTLSSLTTIGVDIVTGTPFFVCASPDDAHVSVNGVSYPSSVVIFPTASGVTRQILAFPAGVTHTVGLVVRVDNASQYASSLGAITPTRQAYYYDLGTHSTAARITSLPQQAADARINAILTAIGLDLPTYSSIDAESRVIQAEPSVVGKTALTLLRDATTGTLGALFENKDGQVCFRSEATTLAAGTVSTLGEAETPYAPSFTFDYDPTLLYNFLTVTRANGTPQYEGLGEDPLSEARYGSIVGAAFTTSLSATTDVDYLAQVLVDRAAWPTKRVSQVTVNSTSNAAPAQFAVEVGDLVGVNRRNPAYTTTGTYRVQKITDTLTVAGEINTTFELSPYNSGVWVLDDDHLSILDVSTILSS